MSKLIPVRRLNKHGVMCTKWVLPETSSASSSSIPAPAVAATVPEFDLAHSEIATLYRSHRINHSGFTLKEFDPGAVQAVEWMIESSHEHDMNWEASRMIVRVLDAVNFELQPSMRSDDHDPFVPFNNLAVFGDALMHPNAQLFAFDEMITGLYQFPRNRDFLNEGTDREREQAVALITVVSRIDMKHLSVYDGPNEPHCAYISSPLLADLIMERPESADDIASLINERGAEDIDVIREVLEHGQQALREGIL